jgi:hypothetical protein
MEEKAKRNEDFWGLGIGDWGLANPHPQSPIPIPNPHLICLKIQLELFFLHHI